MLILPVLEKARNCYTMGLVIEELDRVDCNIDRADKARCHQHHSVEGIAYRRRQWLSLSRAAVLFRWPFGTLSTIERPRPPVPAYECSMTTVILES